MLNFLEKALERLWFSCDGHCATKTDGAASCPLMNGENPAQRRLDPETRRFNAGGMMALACIVVFLLPLLSAAGGAYLAGRLVGPQSDAALNWCQTGGLVVGMAVGIGIAKLLVYLMRSKQTLTGGGDE
ncbi:MAG: hypothetical protein ABIG44_11400 [Planctomycetota bacterium]